MALSICIPAYKSVDLILPTLQTVLCQTYRDYEIVICNDSPQDHDQLEALLKQLGDPRITFFRNDQNLGYPGNLRKCIRLARNDLVFLLGHDDYLLGNTLLADLMQHLERHPELGGICRPYYWFGTDPRAPIRHTRKLAVSIVDITSATEDLQELIFASGQLSGLIFRKSLVTHDVHDHIFTAHVYPFLSILRQRPLGYWPEFTVAVRVASSQTRYLSTIYRPAPTKTWMDLMWTLFPEERFTKMRNAGIELMSRNYVGLAQIKNYGSMQDLIVDIGYLIKYRPANLLIPKFWLASLGALFIPRLMLRWLVDTYKGLFLKYVYARQHIMEGVPPVASGSVLTPQGNDMRTWQPAGTPTKSDQVKVSH